jgi:hypothetical protein
MTWDHPSADRLIAALERIAYALERPDRDRKLEKEIMDARTEADIQTYEKVRAVLSRYDA